MKSVVVEPCWSDSRSVAAGKRYPKVPPSGRTREERTDARKFVAVPPAIPIRTGPFSGVAAEARWPKASPMKLVALWASVKLLRGANEAGEYR